MPDILLQITGACFLFLLSEIVEVLVIVKDEGGWKWRFGEAEGFPQLNPYVSTWIIAVAVFVIVILIPTIVGFLYWDQFLSWIASFAYWGLLLLVSVGVSYLWLWHHVIGKDWDVTQYAILAGSILVAVLFLHLNGFG